MDGATARRLASNRNAFCAMLSALNREGISARKRTLTMPICQHCGASVKQEATACPACGAALPASGLHARPRADAADAGTGAGTSPLRIALAFLILALFGLGFWTLIRNGTDFSTPRAERGREQGRAADAPIRRAPAANSAAPVATPADAHSSALGDTRRISVAEAAAALQNGTAVMADVRSRDAYNTRRIKDAVLLDEETLHGSLDHLPKDKLIITYCA